MAVPGRLTLDTTKMTFLSSFWKHLSPLRKLLVVSVTTALLAVITERWGLLIALISTVMGIAYLTDQALTARSDPQARLAEGIEKGREVILEFLGRLSSQQQDGDELNAEKNPNFKERSDSMATSPRIPDLEIDLDPACPISQSINIQKKISLEFNSIILLIIRDFVQFWYHRFTYNSLFLKDMRHFLFKAFTNLADRISRLCPQKTSVRVIRAYHKHLVSFQVAQILLVSQEMQGKSSQKAVSGPAKSKVKRMKSVDETFCEKFKFHPAVVSPEAEKRYLRSLTRFILLCSCSKDVVSAQSAQCFLVEVLSMNVLLPVISMLSNPHRLYEIIIRLAYNDSNTVFSGDVLKELIDLELKRRRMESISTAMVSPVLVSQGNDGENVTKTESEFSETLMQKSVKESSQASGRAEPQLSLPPTPLPPGLKSGNKPNLPASGRTKCGVTDQALTLIESSGVCRDPCKLPGDGTVTDKAAAGRPPAGELLNPERDGKTTLVTVSRPETASIKSAAKTRSGKSGRHSPSPDSETKASGILSLASEAMQKLRHKSRSSSPDVKAAALCASDTTFSSCLLTEDSQTVQPGASSASEKNCAAPNSATASGSFQDHVYSEMISTGIPSVKPKLQAFKDLFKSKKSKQQDELGSDVEKNPSISDPLKHAISSTGIQKEEEITDGKSTLAELKGSILRTQKLKSLRLSPLLGRSSKAQAVGQTSSPALLCLGDRGGAATGRVCEAEVDKTSPAPQQTPSPSQLLKSGPLSFFDKFRKGSSDSRKTPPAEVSPVECGVTLNGDLKTGDKTLSPSTIATVPSVRITATEDDSEKGHRSQNDIEEKTFLADESTALTTKNTSSALTGRVLPLDAVVSAVGTKPSRKKKTKRLFFTLGLEEAEEGEAVEEGEEEGERDAPGIDLVTEVVLPDSSLIFQDISIPSTETCQEFRGTSQFTVYHIEYEALHFSESGMPVLKTGTAKRRYREFVNLMSRLEDNPSYKRLLKGVKGPNRWLTLPFKNMDKDSVATRQKALEQFLKSLIEVEAVCNGPELREFLAYEGDTHIAFVRKATEINVPRIDKMLARTVSGVFDKLKNLPSLPAEVISGIRGRDSGSGNRNNSESETDGDSLCVQLEFAQELSLHNLLRDISEKFVFDFETDGHIPDALPSSPTSRLLKEVGTSSREEYHPVGFAAAPHDQRDGGEEAKQLLETDAAASLGQLPLCDALIDLVIQLFSDQQHWLCRERVIIVLRNTLGKALNGWLNEAVREMTTEEQCLHSIRLLRETLWPGGKFCLEARQEATEEEKVATRAVAKELLVDLVPTGVAVLVGRNSLETAFEHLLESLQYTQLNKHLLYSVLDLLLEDLFPEVSNAQFGNKLFS